MYSQDYDETIIPGNIARHVQPYLKNKQLMFCPSFSEEALSKASDSAVCDGDDSPNSGLRARNEVPPGANPPGIPASLMDGIKSGYLAHYGIARRLKGGTLEPAACEKSGRFAYYNFGMVTGGIYCQSGGVWMRDETDRSAAYREREGSI